jgi:prophage antirepressor-like protein
MTTQTALQIFQFESHQLRVEVDEHGNPWFCAKDVCDILEYANHNDAIKKLCKPKGVANSYPLETAGGVQYPLFINEGNLYRLIIKSNKPIAEPFEAKVCDEILPSIRKTGAYIAQDSEAAENLNHNLKKAQGQIKQVEAFWFGKYPHWEIIRKHYYHGYPFRYIAEKVNKSADTCRRAVKSMVARGLIDPRLAAISRMPAGAFELWYVENSRVGW